MREGWETVPLGQVFDTTNSRLGQHADEPDVFSVTKYDGFVPADEYFGKRIASAKLDTYKVVEPDEWAYSTIHIDEGSIARNRLGRRGVVSPMYTTMRLKNNRVHPYYAELLLRSPWMLARYSDAQQGSINRRRSLPWKVFASLTIPLPPFPEQRRIVDLIGALDDTITAAETLTEAILLSRSKALRAIFSAGETLAIGDLLVRIEGGRSPKAVDTPPGSDQEGVLKVSAVTETGFRAQESKLLGSPSVFSDIHRVRANDVLITRANTGPRVGQTCLVDRDYTNLYLCDKTLRLVPKDGVDPAGLVAAMSSPVVREQLSAAATGTSSSMKNISQADMRRARVHWPEDPAAVGALDQSFLATYHANEKSVDRLRDLRSNLLTALLSGEHMIPESYDELMEELAA